MRFKPIEQSFSDLQRKLFDCGLTWYGCGFQYQDIDYEEFVIFFSNIKYNWKSNWHCHPYEMGLFEETPSITIDIFAKECDLELIEIDFWKEIEIYVESSKFDLL